MRKIFVILLVVCLYSTMAKSQVCMGYGRGFGVGIGTWHNLDGISDFDNRSFTVNFTISDFSESVLLSPYLGYGTAKLESHGYSDVTNKDDKLLEFGSSVLFQVSKHIHLGFRVGGILRNDNDNKSFKKLIPNTGFEMQINFNDNIKSLKNKALYFNFGLYSAGVGLRYYFF